MNRVTSPLVRIRSIAVIFPVLAALGVIAINATPTRSQQPGQGDLPAASAPATNVPATVAPATSSISPERIAELEKTLSGAVLAGHFTTVGRNEGNPREERYELGEVKHLAGEMWLVSARIKYGDHDVTLPLTLPIRWSDADTAVISVDKMAFPGLGTYTARVMIYKDHYAGYWSGGDHGGHLFGVLEHPKAEEKKAEAAK